MFDSHFFQMGPTPSNAISGHYIISLIILSYIMAFLASYVALEIAATLRQEKTKSDIWLLFSGAFAMGAGIFTMHFIGMLAFVMPMKMEYDLGETLLSLLVAIVASGFAFLIIRKQEVGYTRLILGGTILGIAIVSMHYIGMTSMQHISISYLPSLFFLSITIAIAASIMALWAMLECEKRKESSYQWLLKLGSALAMGFAISGMHYTGMEAAIFTPMTMPSQESFIFLLSPKKLAIFIAYLASSIIVITLLFNSYRHLILFKLLMGYITILLLTAPLGFIFLSVFQDTYLSITNVKSLSDLAKMQERVQAFGQEALFSFLIALALIILFSLFLSIFLSFQFSDPIEQLKNSAKRVAKGDLTQRVNIALNDEIGQLGLSFNAMVESLAEAKKESDELMSIVAHDLKHPLSVIRQASSLIENEIRANRTDKIAKLNQMIHKESGNLLNLVNDLLAARSFGSAVFQLNRKEVNIHKFAKMIFDFNQLIAQKKGIQFKLSVETEEEEYFFDEGKIEQVINNLLSNAFKFSHSGATVNLVIKSDKSKLRIEVHDEAGGIPEKEQVKVFTKFAKLGIKPTAGESSHGLGLAICQDIIKAHDGFIYFKSKPGEGTIFYFEIQAQPTRNMI